MLCMSDICSGYCCTQQFNLNDLLMIQNPQRTPESLINLTQYCTITAQIKSGCVCSKMQRKSNTTKLTTQLPVCLALLSCSQTLLRMCVCVCVCACTLWTDRQTDGWTDGWVLQLHRTRATYGSPHHRTPNCPTCLKTTMLDEVQ